MSQLLGSNINNQNERHIYIYYKQDIQRSTGTHKGNEMTTHIQNQVVKDILDINKTFKTQNRAYFGQNPVREISVDQMDGQGLRHDRAKLQREKRHLRDVKSFTFGLVT